MSKKTEDIAAKLTSMANAADVANMSDSELTNYFAASQDRMLESGDQLAVAFVHATRRAMDRAKHQRDIPFGKLLSEEMETAMTGLQK